MFVKFKYAAFFAAIALAAVSAAASVKTFREDESIFRNPGQGWLKFGPAMPPIEESLVNYGAGYERFEWSQIEPEEGKYNWEIIDRCLRNWQKAGYPFYFRIMVANYHSVSGYCTPKWVFKKGAKEIEIKPLEDDVNYKASRNDPFWKIKRTTPEFDDEILIAEHEKFIKALAARYDGHPALGGVDIGSYGNWGEWHVEMLPIKPATLANRKRFADMYLDNFKKTPLQFLTMDNEVLEYSIGTQENYSRVGLRRDGIGHGKYMGDWMNSDKYKNIKKLPDVWKTQQVTFEWINNYRILKHWTNFVNSVDWMLANHVNLVNDGPLNPRLFDRPEHIAQLRRIDRLAGARLVLKKAIVEYADGTLNVALRGVNKGCSRIALPYDIVYSVMESPETVEYRVHKLNQDFMKVGLDKTLLTFKSATDPTGILPGKFKTEDSKALDLPAGKYVIKMAIKSRGGVYRNFRPAVLEADPFSGELVLGEFEIPQKAEAGVL